MTALVCQMPPCECGCGRWARTGSRFIQGHNRRSAPFPWTVDEVTGCWEWAWSKTRPGYGLYTYPATGRSCHAHRMVYEQHYGEIPEGLVLDHLCRNRGCVNPEHLEPVTQRENILRGESHSARNARKTHCPKGHPYDEENTRVTTTGARVCRTCANAHGLRYHHMRRAAA